MAFCEKLAYAQCVEFRLLTDVERPLQVPHVAKHGCPERVNCQQITENIRDIFGT